MAETNQNQQVARKEVSITDQVLARVTSYTQTGGLKLPDDYSPENALKSAYLILQETKDREGKLVLQVCSKESIANALFDMVVRGLNPIKHQCYFVPYGSQLKCTPSYFGNIATAKRLGLKSIVANVVFEKDEFAFEIDPQTGRRKVTKHVQAMENIDIDKIKGGYAYVTLEDGSTDVEIMTMLQIKQAWMKGPMKGNSDAHKSFTDQMAKRTIINRACKTIINSSSDGNLHVMEDDETIERNNANAKANAIDVGFVDAIDVTDAPPLQETGKAPAQQTTESVDAPTPEKVPANPGGKLFNDKPDF